MPINGTDVLVKVNTGTVMTPVWTTVAGQRDFSRSESNDTIDYSSKDARQWQGAAGRYESEGSLDGLIPTAASIGFDALKAAQRSGTLIMLQTEVAGVAKEKASAIITSLDEEYGDQSEATFSMSYKVTGAWTPAT